MERVHRTGGDVGVAFKVAAAEAMRSGGDSGHAGQPSPVAPSARPGRLDPLRRALRPMLRVVLRAFRPAVRPILIRLRGFFMAGTHAEIVAMRDELRHTLRLAREEADVLARRTRENQALLTSSLIEQLQATEKSFQHQLWATAESLRQQMTEFRPAPIEPAAAARVISVRPDAEQLDRIEHYALHAARRAAIDAGRGALLIRTQVGYVLSDVADRALTVQLFDAGELEPGTRLLVERLLHAGDTFVDVGANVGMISLGAARAMGGVGRIIAFEPFPRTAELLRETMWINGFGSLVELHEVAVAALAGREKLHIAGTSGQHSLFALEGMVGATSDSIDVEVTTLDAVLGDGRVDLIKIDAEGAELDILAGARRVITRNPGVSLIVEFGPAHLERVGRSVDSWFNAFEDLGFGYEVIDPVTGMLDRWDRARLASVDSVNLYFSKARPIA